MHNKSQSETTQQQMDVSIIVTSDTHGFHDQLQVEKWPKADVFIHAGDFTMDCHRKELQLFRQFVSNLTIAHKIIVPGNHESAFSHDYIGDDYSKEEIDRERNKFKEVCYFLQFQLVEIEGIRIMGISSNSAYFDWNFDYAPQQGRDIIDKYKGKVDVLVTHWPPLGILDKVNNKQRGGSRGLLNFVKLIGPRIHLFGHIHQGYGCLQKEGIKFYNASSVNRSYELVNDFFFIKIKRPSKNKQQQNLLK